MTSKNKGRLVVVSGFSGAGKGTVIKELVNRYGYRLSISATTRNPREGEVDGIHYFFRTKDEFQDLIKENGFIEYARYVDNYYGTPRKFVEEELEEGHTVLLEIEVQGALAIKEQYPDSILIFITAPSAGELMDRLTGRGTESVESAGKRMRRARIEAESIDAYDYFVCNEGGRPDMCAEAIHDIIRVQGYRRECQADLIQEIRKDLDEFNL